MKNPEFRTRFAPSPTGPLHLGHAYSALLAFDRASAENGAFILRIEDIDQSRARKEWEEAIYEDLRWLGLKWETPAWRQSDRMDHYKAALDSLWNRRLLFACSCNRRDVREAAAAPHEGELVLGPDGIVYPGTCRTRKATGDGSGPPEGYTLRLDLSEALAQPEAHDLFFTEDGHGPAGETGQIELGAGEMLQSVGDVVLSRRGMGTSYHLSVVVDDAAQRISHVVRGEDLFEATQVHVLLQRILGLPTPVYHHHRLIRDDAGKRLAKRDDARAVRSFREAGLGPDDIRRVVGLSRA